MTCHEYLLDTCTLLWYFDEEKSELSAEIEDLIDSPYNSIFVSVASLWEIAIKISNKKLDVSFEGLIEKIVKADFIGLPIDVHYLRAMINLDEALGKRIHKDPFDRLIIATAQVKGMTIVTPDRVFQEYNIDTIW